MTVSEKPENQGKRFALGSYSTFIYQDLYTAFRSYSNLAAVRSTLKQHIGNVEECMADTSKWENPFKIQRKIIREAKALIQKVENARKKRLEPPPKKRKVVKRVKKVKRHKCKCKRGGRIFSTGSI